MCADAFTDVDDDDVAICESASAPFFNFISFSAHSAVDSTTTKLEHLEINDAHIKTNNNKKRQNMICRHILS